MVPGAEVVVDYETFPFSMRKERILEVQDAG
jgi:hypothetical protein